MGVMIPDVVVWCYPEHDGHQVEIKHTGDPITPTRTWWVCIDCDVHGVLSDAQWKEALEGGVAQM